MKDLDKIGELCVKFYQLYNEMEQTIGPLMPMLRQMKTTDLTSFIAQMKWLSDMAGEVKKFYTVNGEEAIRNLYDLMVDDDIDSLDHGGYRWTPDIDHKFNCPNCNKDEFIKWLKNDPELSELVREDFSMKSVAKHLTERLEKGHKPPELVKHYPKPTIKQRKLPSR